MRLLVSTLVGLALWTGAAQASWSEYQPVPLAEVPISSALKGWESGDWRTVAQRRTFNTMDNTSCYSEHIYTNFRKGSFWGTVNFRETRAHCTFSDTTIRAMTTSSSWFRDTEVEFGTNGAVDNGAAEYRYLMFSSTKAGKRTECMGFSSAWRNFVSQGVICNSAGSLTEAMGRTFLQSLNYKDYLSPVAGSLE
ncbi:hypothetical protein ACFSM5_16005 [Lacibacterium aquatile]|uniref:Uncharacterized protein n=1 Tax=Lacibacterium aquatile TaxID=1168082 RepID=A0ABW5DUN5_9PROT